MKEASRRGCISGIPTPISRTSGPAHWLFQRPPAESKFLAAVNPNFSFVLPVGRPGRDGWMGRGFDCGWFGNVFHVLIGAGMRTKIAALFFSTVSMLAPTTPALCQNKEDPFATPAAPKPKPPVRHSKFVIRHLPGRRRCRVTPASRRWLARRRRSDRPGRRSRCK